MADTTLCECPVRVAHVLDGRSFGRIGNWPGNLSPEYRESGVVVPGMFNLSGTGTLPPE